MPCVHKPENPPERICMLCLNQSVFAEHDQSLELAEKWLAAEKACEDAWDKNR